MNSLLNRGKELFVKNRSFVLYILIGFTGLTLDMLAFWLMVKVIGLNPLIANPISMTIGIVNNFFINAFFNFKKTDKLFRRLLTFYAVGLFGILVSDIFIYLVHDLLFGRLLNDMLIHTLGTGLLSYEIYFTKAMAIVLIAIMQFFLNRKFSFKE